MPYFRTLVITSGLDDKKPWWWDFIDHDRSRCELDYRRIQLKGGKITSLLSLKFVAYAFQVLSTLAHARRRYRNVLTFECGLDSFLIAFFQTLTCTRRPRHVILQFIMREKQQSLRSKIKYAFMRWCFSSVHLCVCSSRAEIQYYRKVFDWPDIKFAYVPLHTDPRLLEHESRKNEGFVLSAGRTLRDYGTLLTAFRGLDVPLLIIASRSSIDERGLPQNVRIQYDIPGSEFVDLMARSLAVVLPLENRMISIGQSVLLQAMTLGKAVIVTRVNGTEDYIEHMKTGIFVPPKDSGAIEAAILMLTENEELRLRLGKAARARIEEMYLPRHYAKAVSTLLG